MSLQHLGLGQDAERVYQCLLLENSLSMDRLVEVTGLSRSRLEAGVDELLGNALVRRGTGETSGAGIDTVLLLSPDAALSALIARHEADIADRQRQLTESRAAVTELLSMRSGLSRDGNDEVERIVGADAVRARLDQFAGECESEVWSFNPTEQQSVDSLAKSRAANLETLERGVQMRAIYLDSLRNHPPSLEHAELLSTHGAEVRTTSTLPLRMIIVDRQRAIVPIDERDARVGALVVTGRGMVAGLSALFVSTWKAAQPLGPRQVRDPGHLSTQEQQALRLWAHGRTDAAVARALGVSERTVRRMSESLADRLEANSRFQAGARAVDVGWLTTDDLI